MPTFGKRTASGHGGIERRKEPRYRVSARATIHYGLNESVECSLEDISASGASLIVTSLLGIPQRFALRIQGQPLRQAAVVRMSPRRIMIRFCDA